MLAGCAGPDLSALPKLSFSLGDLRLPHATEVAPEGPRQGLDPSSHEACILVLVFIGLECPIANAYAPEIQAIAREYAPRGVSIALACVDRDADEARVRAHSRAYGYGLTVLIDREHEFVDELGARVTPEVFVVAKNSKAEDGSSVLYRGRIDDLFVAPGKKRTVVTSHDLRDALEALLAGAAPATRETEAVGCVIE